MQVSDEEGRLYSDKETKAILARAVELSRTEEGGASGGGGTSLAELERVAAEAGLSVDALRRAARELESSGSSGSDLRRFFKAEVAGKRVVLSKLPDRAGLERLLFVLPDIVKASGSGSVVENGLVWRSDIGMSQQKGYSLRVEIGPDAGGSGGWATVSIDPAWTAGGLYGGLGGGIGLGMGLGIGLPIGLTALHSAAFAVLFPLACLGGSFLLAYGIMSLLSGWARKRVDLIAEEISRRLGGV